MRDRTAQTEPLTTGQKLVARWESADSGWSEPADLAEAIDQAIAAAYEDAAKIAENAEKRALKAGATNTAGYCLEVASAIRARAKEKQS